MNKYTNASVYMGNSFLLRNVDTGTFIQGNTIEPGLYEVSLDINNVKKGYYWSILVNQISKIKSPLPASRVTIEYSGAEPIYTTHDVVITHTNGQTVSYHENTHLIDSNSVDILSYSPVLYTITTNNITTSTETPRPYATKVNIICTDINLYNGKPNVVLSVEIEYYTNPLA